MDNKSIMRACVILRDVVRHDPALSRLELSVGDEAVPVTIDSAKQSALVMGPDAAAKYLAPESGPH
jgi:hypothetical protein